MDKEKPSALLQYLNEYFPVSQYNQEGGWNNQVFEHKIFTQLGCNISIEDVFYSFKYEVCVVLTWTAQVDECRGIIAKRGRAGWEIVSRPFDKFFNQDEVESGWSEAKFNESLDRLSIVEKADGTCIQLWYCDPKLIEETTQHHIEYLTALEQEEADLATLEANVENSPASKETDERKRDYAFQRKNLRKAVRKKNETDRLRMCQHKNGWRASTLGRVTPSIVIERAFWKFFPEEISLELQNEYCYIFELCCESNRVVTQYPEDKIFLIAARHLKSGSYLTFEQLDSLAQKLRDQGVVVYRPVYRSLKAIGVHSLEDCKKWIEQESLKTNVYGTCPEGFVIYLDNIPNAKMKNKGYHNTHQLRTGNLLFVRNLCITAFFQGTLDDIFAHLRPSLVEFIAELKAKFQNLLNHYITVATQIRTKVMTDISIVEDQAQKEAQKWKAFAQEVKSGPYNFEGKYNLAGFIFSQKKCIMDGTIDSNQFVVWLKQNHFHFHEYWKQSNVPEIVEAEKLQEKVTVN